MEQKGKKACISTDLNTYLHTIPEYALSSFLFTTYITMCNSVSKYSSIQLWFFFDHKIRGFHGTNRTNANHAPEI